MAKEKSPAFQFYPREYQTDENVKAMTHEERGMYVDLLCVCWQEGSLPASPRRLARLLGVSEEKLSDVWEFIGPCFDPHPENPDRLIHGRLDSERQKQREWREKKALAGRKSGEARRRKSKGDNDNEHRSNTVRTEQEHTTNKTERTGDSRQETGEEREEKKGNGYSKPSEAVGGNYPAEFEEAWKAYPRKLNSTKKAAYRAWLATINRGATPDEVMAGVRRYAEKVRVEKTEERFVKQAETFFGPDEHWRTDWKPERDPRREYDGRAAAEAKEAERQRQAAETQRQEEDELAARRISNWIQENPEQHDALRKRLAKENDLNPSETFGKITLMGLVHTEVSKIIEQEAAA